MRRMPPLLRISPRLSYHARHELRREFNWSRLLVVQTWCELVGVQMRVNTDNVVRFRAGPRAYATWVLSRGHLTLCSDWLAYPTSVCHRKVYDYTEVLYHLETWHREATLDT